MKELHRVAATAEARGAGLSLARLSFDPPLDPPRQPRRGAHHRAAVARQRHRLPRPGRLDPDRVHRDRPGHRPCGRAPHRQRAQHTTLTLGAERTRLGPTVALAAFRPRDTVETLVARTIERMVAAE